MLRPCLAIKGFSPPLVHYLCWTEKGTAHLSLLTLIDNDHVLKPIVLKHSAASQVTIFHFSHFIYPINTLNKAALS